MKLRSRCFYLGASFGLVLFPHLVLGDPALNCGTDNSTQTQIASINDLARKSHQALIKSEHAELLQLLQDKGIQPDRETHPSSFGFWLFQGALNGVWNNKGEISVFTFDLDGITPMSWILKHINTIGEEEVFLIFKNRRADSSEWTANITYVKNPEPRRLSQKMTHEQIKRAEWISLSKLGSLGPKQAPPARISAQDETVAKQLWNEADQYSPLQKDITNEKGELIARIKKYHDPSDAHGTMRILEQSNDGTTLTLVGLSGFGAGPRGSLENLSPTELESEIVKARKDSELIEHSFTLKEFQDASVLLGGVGSVPRATFKGLLEESVQKLKNSKTLSGAISLAQEEPIVTARATVNPRTRPWISELSETQKRVLHVIGLPSEMHTPAGIKHIRKIGAIHPDPLTRTVAVCLLKLVENPTTGNLHLALAAKRALTGSYYFGKKSPEFDVFKTLASPPKQ